MGVSGQLHAPAALSPGKSPWYPLDRRLHGPQSQFGCGGEEKNSQPLPGLKPLIIQPITQHYTTQMHKKLFGKPDGKKPLGRPRRRWKEYYNES
jgi:hypothetical protein